MRSRKTPISINLHDQARKAAFEKKIKEDPSNVTVLWGYSKLLFKLSDLEGTIVILKEILTINPKNFDAGLLLIDCLSREGSQEEALHHARKMEAWYPQNARLLRKLVGVLANAGEKSAAKACLDRLIELWPDQSETWVAKAEYLTAAGNGVQAIKAWEKAYRTDKTNSKAQLYLGIDACVTEQFEKAETLLISAISALKGKEPESTLGNYYLAYCYKKRGYDAGRIVDIIRVLDYSLLDLSNERIRYHLAEMWVITARYEFELKNYAGAISYLEKVEENQVSLINPESYADYCFVYAEWCFEKQIRERALEYAEKAARLNPDSTLYKEKLKLYRKEARKKRLRSGSKSMAKLKKPAAVLLFIILGWLALPHLKEPGAWYLARIQNDIGAYDNYLERYPDGQFVEKAIAMGEKALWNRISKNPAVEDCDLYLARFPEGRFVEEVTEQREEAMWNAALAENTIDAYFEYFKAYPDGKYNVKTDLLDDKNRIAPGGTSRSSGQSYVRAVMRNADGYTNVRKGKGIKHAVISKVYANQLFLVLPDKDNNWWKVILDDGTRGFIHKSRIKLK